jgi:D-lactate dehydrogenase
LRSRSHASFAAEAEQALGRERVRTDLLHRAALGADASVYGLVPQVVVRVRDEAEVASVLAAARRHGTPVTFRAGGTSLSGQSVTDSVLVMQEPRSFRALEVGEAARTVRLGPGVVGAEANAALAEHHRRIGPDPASISVARIGGIVANNSSGMCCRIEQDAFHTLRSLRAVLADGTVLDTGTAGGREALRAARPDLLARLADLRDRVVADEALTERIRTKYRIKNTMGYCLNAFVEHRDPVDVLQHLLVGSEGTLAFVSEVTLDTVPDPPHRACVLAGFADTATACAAASSLRDAPVAAAELFDAASLRVAGRAGAGDAALLVECRADGPEELQEHVAAVRGVLAASGALSDPAFHLRADPEHGALWRARKGLMPSVAAVRERGSSVIIEDVAVPGDVLAPCVDALQELCARHGYRDAIVFGHALAGNLHFVLSQRFDTDREVTRYGAFLDDVARIVADDLGGSLKAEHGTGRNMAPFVLREWGADATQLMREVKRAFDPDGLLNPGVILTDDPRAHLRDLKTLPPVDDTVDGCMECGFCERVCPSADATLTPRQRIVALRAMARSGEAEAGEIAAAFRHPGEDTCATDGVCSLACPVGIDTGHAMKLRRVGRRGSRLLALAERRFDLACAAARSGLRAAELAAGVVGEERLARWSTALHRWSGTRLPRWGPGVPPEGRSPAFAEAEDPAVVHFPACPGRVFGYRAAEPLDAAIRELARRSGLGLARPAEPDGLCCGLLFESKGRPDLAERARRHTVFALERAAAGSRDVVVDASPCARHLREGGLPVLDLAEWLLRDVVPRVVERPLERAVTVHVPCSAELSGHHETTLAVARACAEHVVPTPEVACCGQAGDRGFAYPELPAAALAGLKERLPHACTHGYSTSRTCEAALELHSGRTYRSLAHLVLDAARGDGPRPA